jgi:hypothetical protein
VNLKSIHFALAISANMFMYLFCYEYCIFSQLAGGVGRGGFASQSAQAASSHHTEVSGVFEA